MRKWAWLICSIVLFSPICFAAQKAIVLDLTGPIGPATQDYVQRGIAYAQKEHAAAVILQLNTPGGLESAMRGINETIITSPIPVIAYVAPAGARAASAGAFIMYASHFAAMAPGTNVGAASPINLFATEKNNASTSMSTSEKKSFNDASAYIRSLAQLRGRNAEWAESAVRKATSISAEEAKKLKVIDDIAADYPQLLQKLDGRSATVAGVTEKIGTKDLQIEKLSPDWRYRFLSFLTNPNIAYLLMLLAMYGLFFELSNPGAILPGVAGVIALLLALYAFQLLPVNYVGLALITVGFAFMLFEIYVSSFGVIGFGGVIAFVIGSIMLFDMHDPNYHLSWTLILTMSVVTITFFFMILSLALRSQKKAVVTGKEGLIGSEGVVISVMNRQVTVRVLGEIWEARSRWMLNPGDKIRVTHIQGLLLIIEPLERRVD